MPAAMPEAGGPGSGHKTERTDVGLIVERRDSTHPWQDHVWRPHAVVPAAASTEAWRVVDRGPGWERYYAGSLPLALYAGETDGYRENLDHQPPQVFIVLRRGSGEREIQPFLATVGPFEALDYLDSGEEIVEAVPMPEPIAAWVRAFVRRHHMDRPTRKRERDADAPAMGEHPFWRPAPVRGRGR